MTSSEVCQACLASSFRRSYVERFPRGKPTRVNDRGRSPEAGWPSRRIVTILNRAVTGHEKTALKQLPEKDFQKRKPLTYQREPTEQTGEDKDNG